MQLDNLMSPVKVVTSEAGSQLMDAGLRGMGREEAHTTAWVYTVLTKLGGSVLYPKTPWRPLILLLFVILSLLFCVLQTPREGWP